MSVDNYTNETSCIHHIKSRCHTDSVPSLLYRSAKGVFSGKYRRAKKNAYKAKLHLYQSEYARLFLTSKGLEPMLQLSDFINPIYFRDSVEIENRENIVLYNPKKGYSFTKKNNSKDSKFVLESN